MLPTLSKARRASSKSPEGGSPHRDEGTVRASFRLGRGSRRSRRARPAADYKLRRTSWQGSCRLHPPVPLHCARCRGPDERSGAACPACSPGAQPGRSSARSPACCSWRPVAVRPRRRRRPPRNEPSTRGPTSERSHRASSRSAISKRRSSARRACPWNRAGRSNASLRIACLNSTSRARRRSS
jgi:hypothetical protein